MNSQPGKVIYRKLKARGISFAHVCEVGVYLPEYSNIIDFIKDGIRSTLVEADPVTVEKIKEFYRDYNIEVFGVAIFDYNGTIKLSRADASTFVSSLPSSPALMNDRYKITEDETFEVPCRIFSDIDDGTIDLLSVDIEGSEWYVIKNLVSRPGVISVETHGKAYTNPFINEILGWMEKNEYITWYKDLSDTIFIKKGLFEPGLGDRIETRYTELRVKWKKFKQSFKKKA